MEAEDSRLLPAPRDDLTVVSFPSPLRTDHEVRKIAPGATVSEILEVAGISEHSGLDVGVWIEGHKIPREWWPRTRPNPGTSITAHVIPHGGGGGTGKSVLMIILGIALIATGFLAPIGGTVLAFGLSAQALSLVVAGGIAAIGGISSLVAPPPQMRFDGDIPTSQESPAILGTRNTARPYAAKRRVLGQHLVFPDYGAKPYTEQLGSDQYLRILFEVGYGPLQLTELKIGDTPLDELTTQYTVLPGYDDDPALSIFTLGADELPLTLTLDDGMDPVVRNTELDTYESSLDITFPAGLIAIRKSTGSPKWVKIEITLEYREEGTADPWTGITANTLPDGTITPGVTNPSPGEFYFWGKVQGQITRGISWDFPAAGQYEVRVTRVATEAEGEGQYDFVLPIADQAVWSRLRSIRPGTPPRVDNLCMVEMRIRSTDQIHGLIDDFNCLATSVLPVWNAVDEWGPDNKLTTNLSLQATRTPAWCYAEYLRGSVNSLPIPDERIDALSLAAWAVQTNGDGRYIDAVVDFDSTLLEVIRDIAGVGRASFSLIDGRYGVVYDAPRITIAQHFTPRNVHGFSLTKVFKSEPHAIRVSWMSPDAGWQPDIRIVYADGYNDDGSDGLTAASEFIDMNLWGVTDPDIVFRDARYHMAAARLRPEIFSFEVDVEHLPVNRGDRIVIQHDVMKVGLGAGRIKTITIDTGKLLSFTVDDEWTYNPEAEHSIRIRKSDGETLEAHVVNWPDPSSTVTIAQAGGVAWTGDAPAVQDLVMFGERDVETIEAIVHAVTPLPDLRARIECVDYAPEIFVSDTEEIPPYDPHITDTTPPQLKVPPRPAIESVVSDESVLEVLGDGTLVPRIVMSVSVSPGTDVKAASLQVQHRTSEPEGDWASQIIDAGEQRATVGPVESGSLYDLRVRSISADGRASAWAAIFDHFVVGVLTPPDAPENLRVEPTDWLIWEYPEPPRDFAGFRIRHQSGTDATWSTGIPAHQGLITENRFSIAQLPAGQRTIMLVAVDRGNRVSSPPATVVVTLAGPDIENVVAGADYHALGFPGTLTDCTVNGGTGDLESDPEVPLFWTGDLGTAFWDGAGGSLFWGDGYKAMTYEFSWVVPAAAVGGQLLVPITITAGAYSLQYREQGATDWLTWPGSITAALLTYEFRLWAAGGVVQTVVTALATQVDVPDLREFINNVVIPIGGAVVPPTLPFALITQVYVRALQPPPAGAMSVQVTKPGGWQVGGATFNVFDAAGANVGGVLDIEYVGY